MVQGALPEDDRYLIGIARDIADNWHEVSIELGLPESVVNSVVGAIGTSPDHMKSYHMLQEWKHRASDDFTYQNLALALEKSGLSTVAKKYCYEPAMSQD